MEGVSRWAIKTGFNFFISLKCVSLGKEMVTSEWGVASGGFGLVLGLPFGGTSAFFSRNTPKSGTGPAKH